MKLLYILYVNLLYIKIFFFKNENYRIKLIVNLLSEVGHITLIRSVHNGILVNVMQLFRVQFNTCDVIDRTVHEQAMWWGLKIGLVAHSHVILLV